MSVRVLGIDPGLTRCGWGIVDVAADRSARLVAVGVVGTEAAMSLPKRLRTVADALESLMDEHRPQAIALEQVFAQHNVQSVMGVAQISGVVLVMAERRGLPVGMHTPSEVKAAVTGYGSADKAQVGAMVARILRLSAVPKPADAADALALALCHAWRAGATVPASAARSAADGAAAAGASRAPASPALTPAQQRWLAAERSRRPGAPRPRLDP